MAQSIDNLSKIYLIPQELLYKHKFEYQNKNNDTGKMKIQTDASQCERERARKMHVSPALGKTSSHGFMTRPGQLQAFPLDSPYFTTRCDGESFATLELFYPLNFSA